VEAPECVIRVCEIHVATCKLCRSSLSFPVLDSHGLVEQAGIVPGRVLVLVKDKELITQLTDSLDLRSARHIVLVAHNWRDPDLLAMRDTSLMFWVVQEFPVGDDEGPLRAFRDT
jgi:hypothetical protein